MFVSRSNLINSRTFGNSVFDSIRITNSAIALDIYDTSLNSIFRVDTRNGGTITASNINITGNIIFSAISLDDGSATTPSLNFINATSTGLYHVGGGEFSLVSNEIDIIKMNTTGVSIFREIIMDDVNGTGDIKINGAVDQKSNISIGYAAGDLLDGSNAIKNILIGYMAGDEITSGSNNICIGSNTGSTVGGSNNILIGDGASITNESDKLVFRNINNILFTGNFATRSLFFDTGISNPVNTVPGDTYTIVDSDYIIRCTHALGAITVNLPSIVADQSRTLIIINESSSQVVTISTSMGGGFIDDGSAVSFLLSYQYDRVVLRSNGVASGGTWYTV